MRPAPATNAVVTGTGVIAPNGLGLDAYWDALMRGRSGISRITRFDPDTFPSRLAGEVTGFVPEEHLSGRMLTQTDRMTRYSLAAAAWALEEAGDGATSEPPAEPLTLGVVTAGAAGGIEFGQRELQNLWSKSPKHVSAYMSFAWFYAVNSGQIAIRHDMRGPVGVVVTEQAGGLDAIAQARRKIAGGAAIMVTGGMDSALCPYGLAALVRSGRLSRGDDPARAYLPFDRRACGHVPGEGGAILTMEARERARARGARVLGEIAGYGASFDPRPGSGRGPNLHRAIETALADAGASPADVAVVFADASGVPELDAAEAAALETVFGPRGVAVTAPKALTGRLLSGGGPLDVLTAIVALREGVAPPTANVTDVDPDLALDLVVGEPRRIGGDVALVLARGYGGFNSAVAVRAEHA